MQNKYNIGGGVDKDIINISIHEIIFNDISAVKENVFIKPDEAYPSPLIFLSGYF